MDSFTEKAKDYLRIGDENDLVVEEMILGVLVDISEQLDTCISTLNRLHN